MLHRVPVGLRVKSSASSAATASIESTLGISRQFQPAGTHSIPRCFFHRASVSAFVSPEQSISEFRYAI